MNARVYEARQAASWAIRRTTWEGLLGVKDVEEALVSILCMEEEVEMPTTNLCSIMGNKRRETYLRKGYVH